MDWFYTHTLAERQLMLVAALLLSAVAFGPPALLRRLQLDLPPRLLKALILRLEVKLNRARRNASTRVYRGMVLLGFMLALTWLLAYGMNLATGYWPAMAYAEIVLLAWLMPVRPLWDNARQLRRTLKKHGVNATRQLAAPMARRHTRQLDEHALMRIGIEYLIENFADKILAPALWYLLLGLPGALMVCMVNLLDGIIGHHSQRYIAFGWAAAKLDDLMQWVPARIAALLLWLAAFFIPKGRPMDALRVARRDAHKTRSPNNGWPLATAAGALHVTLGGPREIGEGVVEDAWLGNGSAKASPRDLARAQWLYMVAVLLGTLTLAAFALWQQTA